MAGRVVVAASGYLLAVIVLGPGIFSGILFVSLPLYVVGAFALAVPNPPLDAARLDVIHHALWGRAEAVRSVLRTVGEAGAPLLFGFLADHLLGGGTKGLEYTFLLMLLPLAAAGVLLLRARAPYIQDVASASESERRTDEPEQRRATG
jgi:hypothetical protein